MWGLVSERERPARPASTVTSSPMASARGPTRMSTKTAGVVGIGGPGSALRFDETQVAGLPAVQHVDGAGAGVAKHEKAIGPGLDGHRGGFDRERLHVVTRCAHDTRPFAVFGWGCGKHGLAAQRRLPTLA